MESDMHNYPSKVLNWINNEPAVPANGEYFDKINPATGARMARVARSTAPDVDAAISSATLAYESFCETSVFERGSIIRRSAQIIQERKEQLAQLSALEAGKSVIDGRGEIEAVIEMGFFVAGEGRRYYGRTTTSAVENRTALTVRQPVGVCALITPSSNPLAGIAWKAFPAILCGNTVVSKPSEHTPYMNVMLGEILKEAGLPAGVYSVVQGIGKEVGPLLANDPRIDLISFTGSVAVGRYLQTTAAERLAKVALELGGKNPFVVCDDADLEAAAENAVLSAFSSAGQRCAAGSRIIVFSSIYDEFKKMLVERTESLKLGTDDSDDFGPVISQTAIERIDAAVKQAVKAGGRVLTGGKRAQELEGFYYQPTIIEGVSPQAEISRQEMFGPVTVLYRVSNFNEALVLANNSLYGLTAAIHTKNIHRIEVFRQKIRTGVVSVNGPTYGSEPHLPFGGLKLSGNGWREAGTEALDVFSDWKTIYIKHDPSQI